MDMDRPSREAELLAVVRELVRELRRSASSAAT